MAPPVSACPPLPPLCKAVAKRYDSALMEERSNRDARVATLENAGREVTTRSTLEAAQRRADGERSAREATAAAEERVEAIQRDRQRLLKEHRLDLRAIEEAIDKNRVEADERLRTAEDDTAATHASGDEEVARIFSERDAATRAARARCAAAERAGEERIRRADEYEGIMMAQAKKLIAEEQALRKRTCDEAQRVCSSWTKNADEKITNTMQQVAARIIELMQEARVARGLLEENRARSDAHFQDQVQIRSDDTRNSEAHAFDELDAARTRLRHAEVNVTSMVCYTQNQITRQDRARTADLAKTAKSLDVHIMKLGASTAFKQPEYIYALEELARRLRAGTYRDEPPEMLTELPSLKF